MSSAVQMGAACPAVPVRTVGEQSYRIKELKLRFYNCQTMYAPKDEVSLLTITWSYAMQFSGHCKVKMVA